jgi:OmpA-OmpF porin, OOP family
VAYLVDHGIPADRLVPHGYGKTNFVATNRTKEGHAQNRRVELVPVQ